MIKMLWTILFVVLSVMTACKSTEATPTPVVSSIAWDTYTDVNGKGFYVYWRDQNGANSVYDNANRTKITDVTQVNVLISAIVAAVHPTSMCFALTVYDGVDNESQYSNEVCGFTGIKSVSNVRKQ